MSESAEFCTFCPARGNCVGPARAEKLTIQSMGKHEAEAYFVDADNETSTEVVVNLHGIKETLGMLGEDSGGLTKLNELEVDLGMFLVDRIYRCATPGSSDGQVTCPAFNPEILELQLDQIEIKTEEL